MNKKRHTGLGQSNTKRMSQTVVSQYSGTVPLPSLKFRTWEKSTKSMEILMHELMMK